MRFRKSIVYFSVLMLAMVQDMHAATVIGCVDVPGAYLSSCGFNYPQAIAITPNGLKAYVCNYSGDSVSVINLETNSVTDCVNVPDAYAACGFGAPAAIAITPDGTKAYVCNSSNATVSVIDVETDSVIGCVDASSCGFNAPYAIAITGTKAYVCNLDGSSVSVIDLDTNRVIHCVDVPVTYSSCGLNAPLAIAITPDGTKAYVCNYGNATVSVIDVNTDTVIDCVNVPDTYSPSCGFNEPYAIAITGTKAYVCNSGNSTVSVIDINTDTVIDCVDVPGAYSSCGLNNPQAIAITGTKAYVGNSGNGTVSVIDVNTDTVIDCVDVPGVYSSCAFNDPIAIAITPDGTKAYVCNFNGRSVSIIGIPPLLPTNLSGCILQQGTTITNTLTWDAPTSGFLPNSYNIYRGSDLIATVSGSGYGPFAYEDAGLDPNTTYTYSIYSVYNGITSDDSANITLSVFCYPELFPPSTVSSSCSLENDTMITWEAPTSGATPVEYEIYSDAHLTHLVATVPAYGPGPFMYELTGLDPNMSYIYYIVSVDGYGDKSQPTSVMVGPCISIFPPASVNGCKMQDRFLQQTDYINKISWTAPASGSSPVSYKIYRDVGLTQLVATISASGSLQYYDHNRNPNDVYSYYIVSVDANGNVSIANSVTVTQSC